MKFSIHWLLAALLAFEPAMAVQGSVNLQAEFKKFIEISEMTTKEVSFQEMYDKFGAFLPFEEQQKLKPFLKVFGSVKMPKMDLSKIKDSHGEEIYKLSTIANGQAGSLEFTGEANTVFKLNGAAVSPAEAADVLTVMAKAGIPQQNIAQAFPPVAKKKSMFLSAEEISMMSKEDQVKYIKNFQSFLVTLEAAQKLTPGSKKSAKNSFFQKLEIYSNLFLQEYAWAMKVGDDCVAAGHITKVNRDNNKRLMCGTIPQGDRATDDIRRKSNGQLCSGVKELACNGVLFGQNDFCVPAGIDSTAKCSDLVAKSGKDIPELYKNNKEAFDDLKAKAEEQAKAVAEICKTIEGLKPDGASKGLIIDQKSTCSEFNKRYATIQSWTCDEVKNPEFKKNYPKLCAKSADQQVGVVGGSSGVGADNPAAQTGIPAQQAGQVAGLKKCSELPQYSLTRDCDKGNYKPVDPSVQCLLDDKGAKVSAGTYECVCPAGMTVAKNKCIGTATGSTAPAVESEGAWSKTKSWFSKHSKWLVPLAMGIVGLSFFHFMSKQSAIPYYDLLNPKTSVPPPAPTNPTAPIPRTGVK